MPALRLQAFGNILLLPTKAPRYADHPHVIAGAERLPAFCRHRRFGHTIASAQPSAPPETAPLVTPESGEIFLYGGQLVWHFGHFLAEYVHRLWPLARPEFAGATVLFITPEPWLANRPFFKPLMAWLGVRRWRIISTPCRISNMHIAQSGSFLGEPPKRRYLEHLERLAKLRGTGTDDPPKRIALMRGHLAGKAHFLGEAAFTHWLETQGYTPVVPEDHPLETQFRLLINAEKIIISEGSACHLFDLLPRLKAEIAYIARRTPSTLHRTSIAPRTRRLAAYTRCSTFMAPDGQAVEGPVPQALSVLDHDDLHRFLVHHNFLTPGPPPALNPPYLAEIATYMTAQQKAGTDPVIPRQVGAHLIDHITQQKGRRRWWEALRSRLRVRLRARLQSLRR